MTCHQSFCTRRCSTASALRRQPRRAKSISSYQWVGSMFWKAKPRCVLEVHKISFDFKCECSLITRFLTLLSCCPQFLLYTCPLHTVSFCAVLPSSPKVFGFVARHPAANMYHCYLFQSKNFVSLYLKKKNLNSSLILTNRVEYSCPSS